MAEAVEGLLMTSAVVTLVLTLLANGTPASPLALRREATLAALLLLALVRSSALPFLPPSRLLPPTLMPCGRP